MRRPGTKGPSPAAPRSAREARLIWWTIATFTVIIPIFVWRTSGEPFRLTKELLFRLQALVLIPTYVAAVLRRPRQLARPCRRVMILLMSVGVWSAVCALAGTNLQLSADSMITIVAALVVFLCTVTVAVERSILALDLIVIPAVINAIVFLFQTSVYGASSDVRTALLGNSDDVGSFLCAPALAAAALVLVEQKQWLRYIHAVAVAILIAALLVGAVASLIAFLAGIAVMAFLWSQKRGAVLLAIGSLVIVSTVVVVPSVRSRIVYRIQMARAGDLNALTSYRLLPFYAAWRMATDHPLTGVGPGSFRFEFFDYKLAVERDHHELLRSVSRYSNFGEVHNDHLQVIAETGFIGYAIFLSAIVFLSRISLRRTDVADQRAQTARFLALPVAVAFAIDASAHFPMELAGPRVGFLYIAAVCIAWSMSEPETLTLEPREWKPQQLVLVGACVLLAAIAAFPLVIRPFRCSIIERGVLSRTEIALQNETSDAARIIARENLNRLGVCPTWRYDDTNLLMIRATNLRILGRLPEAAAVYEDALKIDRRPELYLNLGEVLRQLGRSGKAKDAFRSAVLFNFHLLDEIEDPEIHDSLERLLFDQYRYLLPEGRSPTLMRH